MRLYKNLRIQGCELEVSKVDLITRAKVSVGDEVGSYIFNNYPNLIEINQDTLTNDVDVTLDIVVFKTSDFHTMINKLHESLGEEDFKTLTQVMDLKELPNGN